MARVLNLVMSELVGGNSYFLMPWRAIEKKKKHRQKTRTGAPTTRPYVFLFFFFCVFTFGEEKPNVIAQPINNKTVYLAIGN